MKSNFQFLEKDDAVDIIGEKIQHTLAPFLRKLQDEIDALKAEAYLQKAVFDASDIANYTGRNRTVVMRRIREVSKEDDDNGIPEENRVFRKSGASWVADRSAFEAWYLNGGFND